jgi:predicted AlkP superfamily phosphohydrolase/phosphomutase
VQSKAQMKKGPGSKRFIRNRKGRTVAVVLSMKEYRKILKQLEELESIRAYDAAKTSGDVVIPFDQAISEISAEKSK